MGKALNLAGILIEIIGICIAGRGLYLTWKDNVPEEKQVRQLLRRFWATTKRRLRRRKTVTVGIATSWGVAMDAQAIGVVTPPMKALTLELSPAELVRAISQNFDALIRMSVEAQTQLAQTRNETAQSVKKLQAEIAEAHTSLGEQAKSLVVEGVPLAVSGLAITVVGLLLQGAGVFA